MSSHCNTCRRDLEKINFDIKSNGTMYKTCTECRTRLKILKEKSKEDYFTNSHLTTDREKCCSKCRCMILLTDFKIKKNGTLSKMCLQCLEKQKVYYFNRLQIEPIPVKI
jgi:hypothetical protein